MSRANHDFEKLRSSPSERTRTEDLVRLLPKGRRALDIGARDGFFSRLLAQNFESVTAVDIEPLELNVERVKTLQADVTNLCFADRSFDFALCSEVLEHVPALEKACSEISRVTKSAILIGVPFKQDTRVGRTTCAACGNIAPPWGHINTFDEKRLIELFPGWKAETISLVGESNAATSALAAWLMDRAGNPYGSYGQIETCGKCGAALSRAPRRGLLGKICAAIASRMNYVQRLWTKPHGNWIHIVFRRDAA